MKRWTGGSLLALLLTGVVAGAAGDWRSVAWPEDVERIDMAVERARAVHPSAADNDARAFATAQALLERAARPQPLKAITGEWQVRSIQVGLEGTFVYPRFQARIDREGEAFRFDKFTGSQRRSGVLFPLADGKGLAFLGGSRVNDAPQVPYSRIGSAQAPKRIESDTAGRLVRIGARELLLILDAGHQGYELYHLSR